MTLLANISNNLVLEDHWKAKARNSLAWALTDF